jgi:serine/threonine protein phosphatase PrpC
MTAAPAMTEKPLAISVEGSSGRPGGVGKSGRLHVEELAGVSDSESREFVAIMASSFNSPPSSVHEDLAIQGMVSALVSGRDQHLSEILKQGFREANRAVRADIEASGSDLEGVAMLALLTRGKYAALGLVGPDRAYLMRATRLTQLTRDQRVIRARSRRKQDIEQQQAQSGSGSSVALLGEQERLDSRSPAIFEIILLPEDRLGIVSRGVLDLLSEDRILAALDAGSSQGAEILTASSSASDGAPLLAAVLQVGPSREEPVYIPSAATPPRPWWPVLVLIVALFAVAAGVYFFAL